jgi:hypothetical protein
MTVPYSKSFPLLETAGTAASVFALRFPHRGRITNWGFKKTSGNGSGAVAVAIYTDEASAVAADVTRQILTKSAVPPWTEAADVEYINREGSISDPVRKLYARITPSDGAGAQNYTLELTAVQPDLG